MASASLFVGCKLAALVSPWIGGWNKLTFGLLSDFKGSTVAIRDIRFIKFESTGNTVPVSQCIIACLDWYCGNGYPAIKTYHSVVISCS